MDTFDILKEATGSWFAPVLVRTCEGEHAKAAYQEEANVLGRHGYTPQTKKGIRSDASLTATYARTGIARSRLIESSVAVERASDSDTKVCPACAESVKLSARICRYSRHEFWPEGEDPYDALVARERELVGLTEGWASPTVTRTTR